ncbi:MAG: NAD-dependent epimerase/dehydratase family protein [Acidobacteriota bacterium]
MSGDRIESIGAPGGLTGLAALDGASILITGGSGYLASALTRLLSPVRCRIVRMSRQPGANPHPDGAATIEPLVADLREPGRWTGQVRDADVVFHLAAQTSVAVASSRPLDDLAINVEPMLHLLEAGSAGGRSRTIVFAGTVTESGPPQQLPVDEQTPDAPTTVYDLHKLVAEQYLKQYARQGAVQGTTLRLANVYGPGPAHSSADRGILNLMVQRALRGQPVTIYGDGAWLRDYVYVDDVAAAFVLAAARIAETNGRHFVIGTGQGHTIAEALHLVATQVTARTGRPVAVQHVDPPAAQPSIDFRHCVADSRAFQHATGWRPAVDLRTGLARTVDAFLTQAG